MLCLLGRPPISSPAAKVAIAASSLLRLLCRRRHGRHVSARCGRRRCFGGEGRFEVLAHAAMLLLRPVICCGVAKPGPHALLCSGGPCFPLSLHIRPSNGCWSRFERTALLTLTPLWHIVPVGHSCFGARVSCSCTVSVQATEGRQAVTLLHVRQAGCGVLRQDSLFLAKRHTCPDCQCPDFSIVQPPRILPLCSAGCTLQCQADLTWEYEPC